MFLQIWKSLKVAKHEYIYLEFYHEGSKYQNQNFDIGE